MIRRAYVAAAASNSIQAVGDFCSRFEASSASDSQASPVCVNSLDAVAIDNFRERCDDGTSDCKLCLCNLKTEWWSTHTKTKVHAKKVAIVKSEDGKYCQMYESRQLACRLCRSRKMNVEVWDDHIASQEHREAVANGVEPMEGVIDDMEFMVAAAHDPELFTCRLCPRKGEPFPRKYLQKHCQNAGHQKKVDLVRAGDGDFVEMLSVSSVRCKACNAKMDASLFGAHKMQCKSRIF